MALTSSPAAESSPPGRVAASWRRHTRSGRRFLRRHPWSSGIAIAVLAAVVLAYAVGLSIAEPLRSSAERRMNEALDGYQVRIGSLSLNVLGLGVDLRKIEVVQTAHPDPPVAWIERLGASVQWRALLSGEVVGDLVLVEPRLYLDLGNVRSEADDDARLDERGWQEAVQRIYPLEIDAFEVRDGSITYDDAGDLGPIHLTEVALTARNVRNVAADPGTYPSPVHLDAVVFDAGRLRFDGSADFLAQPHAGVRGDFVLEAMPLAPLTAIARRYAVHLGGGTLSLDGDVELDANTRLLDVAHVKVDGIRADFVQAGASGERGARAAKKTLRGATDPEHAPETVVRVADLRSTDGELGYVDRTGESSYRVFVSELDVAVRGFTNEKKSRAPGHAEVSGSFMGSGALLLDASFQPSDARAEFSSNLQITDVDLVLMNDLLRARGGFDVNAGRFSLFSEIAVRDGAVDGYVKPIFSDLDVYDRRQDGEKNVFRQAYEGIVGGIGTLLENRPRDEVATRTDLSGPIESPETSTLEIVIGLVQNAFVRAILPGLEEGASGR